MKTLDLTSWPRRSQYEFFRRVAQPHFSLTASLDVTYLMRELKPAGVAVFNATLYALVGAGNAVPALRTRFRGEQVVEHDVIHAGITVPIADQGFGFCDIEYAEEWRTFDARCSQAVAQAKRQTALADETAYRDQRFFMSCLPWVAFTAMTNAVDGPDDCVPRITWGKITRRADRWQMPVALLVHHALVDGLHLGQFYEVLQQRLNRPL